MEVDSPVLLSPALSSHSMASNLDLQLSFRDNSDSLVQRVEAVTSSDPQPEEEDEEDTDCNFSFVCSDPCLPISADDLFHNGQIKPIFPWLGQEPPNLSENEVRLMSVPVKRLFEAEGEAEGPYCAWSKRIDRAAETDSAAPEACRKSNSTGFSKLRRFRRLLQRSQSDGKDTFLFLGKAEKEETASFPYLSKTTKNGNFRKGKKDEGEVKSKTTASAKSKTTPYLSSYALQYGNNGEKRKEKRKSYLPYRQDLVGFFTNANAISKNIHPY